MSVAEAEVLLLAQTEPIAEEIDSTAGEPSGRATPAPRRRSPSVDDIVTLAANGVGADFLRELHEAGFTMPINDVIAFGANRVSVELLLELRAAGMAFAVHEVIALALNGVTPATIRELRAAGMTAVKAGDIIALGASGLSPGTVADLTHATFNRYSLPELIGMALNGVDARFLAELRTLGKADLPAGELIALGAKRMEAERAEQTPRSPKKKS